MIIVHPGVYKEELIIKKTVVIIGSGERENLLYFSLMHNHEICVPKGTVSVKFAQNPKFTWKRSLVKKK